MEPADGRNLILHESAPDVVRVFRPVKVFQHRDGAGSEGLSRQHPEGGFRKSGADADSVLRSVELHRPRARPADGINDAVFSLIEVKKRNGHVAVKKRGDQTALTVGRIAPEVRPFDNSVCRELFDFRCDLDAVGHTVYDRILRFADRDGERSELLSVI